MPVTGLDPRPGSVTAVPLGTLAGRVPALADALGAAVDGAAATVAVRGVSLDSRAVRQGDLYAALPGGRTHGARFVPQATAAGAVAVLTDHDGAAIVARGKSEVPLVVAARPRAMLGAVAAEVYGNPAESMLTVGVTGTQGKTTVTHLLESGLRSAGRRPGLVGTTGSRADGVPVASRLTTPEAPDLHALLAVMREQGVDAAALEVSSHALVQGRVDGVRMDVAVFCNLGRDHLDFHTDVEDYFAAKASLFTPERARRAVVDVGDPWGRRLAERAAVPTTTCSDRPGWGAHWWADDVRPGRSGASFTVRGPAGQAVGVDLPLPGSFNVRNAVAALVALVVAGLPPGEVAAGLARTPGVPGRMEAIDEGQRFLAVVDYAHKPDAVEAVLSALRPTTRGRLVLVLGAGGDRDPGKRALMGRVAAALADVVVVTDDNPRTEEPATIRAALLGGVDRAAPHADLVEVGDRAEAIEYAIGLARPGDTVVVAGKGHETGQEVAGAVHPFDDRDVLRRLLRAAGSPSAGGRAR